jgi:hypothetical protein
MRLAVGVEAHDRLQQRCGQLKGEGDQADLAEVEIERAFQNRIDRREQRLDDVVEEV